MPVLLCLQELQGKDDGGWKKVSLHHFPADRKITIAWKKMHILGIKNAPKVGSVNFAKSSPSIVKKVCTKSPFLF